MSPPPSFKKFNTSVSSIFFHYSAFEEPFKNTRTSLRPIPVKFYIKGERPFSYRGVLGGPHSILSVFVLIEGLSTLVGMVF